MPADLAEDGGGGEAGESAPFGIEPVDGVEQADRADLDEVVEGFSVTEETLGEKPDQGEMGLDHLVAQERTDRAVRGKGGEAAEEFVGLLHRPGEARIGSPFPAPFGVSSDVLFDAPARSPGDPAADVDGERRVGQIPQVDDRRWIGDGGEFTDRAQGEVGAQVDDRLGGGRGAGRGWSPADLTGQGRGPRHSLGGHCVLRLPS
ncbi:MAG: hypothetical protein P8Z68_00845 [Kineosporiaceae bacterium]